MNDFTFYHVCPLCGRFVDDGDLSGICFYCIDRYAYLSSHLDLSVDDEEFLTRYHDVENAFYSKEKQDT